MQNIPRFLIDDNQINGSRFRLTNISDNKKIKHVLRLKSEDNVILFDGAGTEYLCKLDIVSNEIVSGEVVEKNYIAPKVDFKVTLAQALPKAGKLDDIVRMCTEVGVHSFIFFESDYSIPKLKNYKPKKFDRLKKIIEEATRQSERALLPEIVGIETFQEVISHNEYDRKTLLSTHYNFDSKDIKEVKGELISKKSKNILVIIGAEGGFSERELESAILNQVELVSMKLPILRTQTAGVVGAGFLLI